MSVKTSTESYMEFNTHSHPIPIEYNRPFCILDEIFDSLVEGSQFRNSKNQPEFGKSIARLD